MLGVACCAKSAPPALQVDTINLQGGEITVEYSARITASGDIRSYGSWAITSGKLPEGFPLDSQTGVIQGATNEPGRYEFVVEIKYSQESVAIA